MALIVKILVIIGGVNWGLVGLGMLLDSMGNWNVVNMILGSIPTLEAVIYVLVGISAVMLIFGCKCGKCINGVCVPNTNASKTEGSAQ
ncbi:MAG: hypothetical protein UT09_C0006G0013 [Parcubacteria group bacterium GW2011_GWF2_38_8]|nr:MAG: hypothetical protein UT09_C0006G0013 [Parcubacteria group bacterium GW2011_GWF2_38_8]